MSPALRAAAAAACLLLAMPALARKKTLGPGERIDLHRVGTSELMRLPGVGLKKAQAIVTHRSKSPFQRTEDVVQVKGLGPAWYAKVKGNLTTGAAQAATPAAASGKK